MIVSQEDPHGKVLHAFKNTRRRATRASSSVSKLGLTEVGICIALGLIKNDPSAAARLAGSTHECHCETEENLTRTFAWIRYGDVTPPCLAFLLPGRRSCVCHRYFDADVRAVLAAECCASLYAAR